MAALAPSPVCRRALHAALFPLASMWLIVAGCSPNGNDQTRQFEGLKADLDESKRRLSHLQNSLAAKDAELAVTTTALETAKNGLADMEKVLNDHKAQLRAVTTELNELKKRDALVFAEIAAAQQQGQSTIALTRYQKFVTDYPKSPLVTHANNAIAQLTEGQHEVRRQFEQLDPKRRERDFQKTFTEGYMTLQELAPYLKKKSLAQVLALLGRPNQTFNDNTELGYADRAVNPATGTRGMLIVSFEGGSVSTLRVEYGGRKMTP